MAGERVGCVIGRAQGFDAEAFEEGAGPELRAADLPRQLVVHGSRVLARERLIDPEHAAQHVGQPQAGGCRPEEEEVVGEELPGATVVGFGRVASRAPLSDRNPERLERDPLRIEHPQDVVVWEDEQFRGRPEGRVRVGKELRVDVAVRADDRQAGDAVVDFAGEPSLGLIRREVAVGCRGRFELHGRPSHTTSFVVYARACWSWHAEASTGYRLHRTHGSPLRPSDPGRFMNLDFMNLGLTDSEPGQSIWSGVVGADTVPAEGAERWRHVVEQLDPSAGT